MDHFIPHRYSTYGALDLGLYLNTMAAGGSYITFLHQPDQVLMILLIPIATYIYTLSYCTVDDAYSYTITNKLGRGALLSKIDLKNAFRLIATMQCGNKTGTYWVYTGRVIITLIPACTSIPCGLRSAPFLFNQLADAVHWILQNNYEVH